MSVSRAPRCRIRTGLRAALLVPPLLALIILLACAARADSDMVNVEINGHDFYGTVFTDYGNVYGGLDAVGPLLVGPTFHANDFDFTLRRCAITFVPAGTTTPTQVEVYSCEKRGAEVYAPLKVLMTVIGGSYSVSGNTISLAYPPVSVTTASAPTGMSPPPPLPTAQRSPTQGTNAAPVQPTPESGAATGPTQPRSPLDPTIAMAEVRALNAHAIPAHGQVTRIEIYHPVSPDPSDVIPRTDVAGLKVYLHNLSDRDTIVIEMWAGRDPQGPPVFHTVLTSFDADELASQSLFVRLPLHVQAGWHTVRIDVNGHEHVDYRFVTY